MVLRRFCLLAHTTDSDVWNVDGNNIVQVPKYDTSSIGNFPENFAISFAHQSNCGKAAHSHRHQAHLQHIQSPKRQFLVN